MDSTTSPTPDFKLQHAHLQQRLQEARANRRPRVPPNPPPRYDEIFALGQQWLDRLATEPDCHEEVEP